MLTADRLVRANPRLTANGKLKKGTPVDLPNAFCYKLGCEDCLADDEGAGDVDAAGAAAGTGPAAPAQAAGCNAGSAPVDTTFEAAVVPNKVHVCDYVIDYKVLPTGEGLEFLKDLKVFQWGGKSQECNANAHDGVGGQLDSGGDFHCNGCRSFKNVFETIKGAINNADKSAASTDLRNCLEGLAPKLHPAAIQPDADFRWVLGCWRTHCAACAAARSHGHQHTSARASTRPAGSQRPPSPGFCFGLSDGCWFGAGG